jgi:hypothetical protein
MRGKLLPASTAWHPSVKSNTGGTVASVRVSRTDLILWWIVTFIVVITAGTTSSAWKPVGIALFIVLQTVHFCKQAHPVWPGLVLGVAYTITVANNHIVAIVLPSVVVTLSSAYYFQT